MKLEYTKYGDYYIPNLILAEENQNTNGKTIGKYGKLRLNFLRANNKILYNKLLLNNRLHEHLVKTNENAKVKLNILINELAKRENIDENLKATNQLEWVQKMNNIKNRAEEIILNELIYV